MKRFLAFVVVSLLALSSWAQNAPSNAVWVGVSVNTNTGTVKPQILENRIAGGGGGGSTNAIEKWPGWYEWDLSKALPYSSTREGFGPYSTNGGFRINVTNDAPLSIDNHIGRIAITATNSYIGLAAPQTRIYGTNLVIGGGNTYGSNSITFNDRTIHSFDEIENHVWGEGLYLTTNYFSLPAGSNQKEAIGFDTSSGDAVFKLTPQAEWQVLFVRNFGTNSVSIVNQAQTPNPWTNSLSSGESCILEYWPEQTNWFLVSAGGGGGGGGVDAGRVVTASSDTVAAGDYLLWLDTTANTNITLTLPDMAADSQTIVVRRLGNTGAATIARGTNTWTLAYDGDGVTVDWLGAATNWFWRDY